MWCPDAVRRHGLGGGVMRQRQSDLNRDRDRLSAEGWAWSYERVSDSLSYVEVPPMSHEDTRFVSYAVGPNERRKYVKGRRVL